MHLAKVIGTVVATEKTPNLKGLRLLLIQPYTDKGEKSGRPLVAVDTVSAAPGQMIFFVRGREAANALEEKFNPVDAAIVGIVDKVEHA